MKKPRKPLIDADGEVRELTKADIARMRPATEAVPEVVEAGAARAAARRRPSPSGR